MGEDGRRMVAELAKPALSKQHPPRVVVVEDEAALALLGPAIVPTHATVTLAPFFRERGVMRKKGYPGRGRGWLAPSPLP
ncbi:hypothetical protein CEXT_369741 [Caerostris extrusa]|uniref:Uncharacterized protein n=1 Tax=Caerostris extrusa TaxID=172846 RepID=A0AAV4UP59_CAEEX|nr:hypothetical protein CEXT_369741 [Caerostris extrusa]